jgi:hypothetical protein
MIEQTVERWHRFLAGDLPGGLDELLADDVVFWSPIVHSPQKGKDLTKLYLTAAGKTLGNPSFRYTKEILDGRHAALEFEVDVGGKYVNGVDLLTCDGEGRISEFRVMIRPLQAVNLIHQQMMAMLAQLKGSD